MIAPLHQQKVRVAHSERHPESVGAVGTARHVVTDTAGPVKPGGQEQQGPGPDIIDPAVMYRVEPDSDRDREKVEGRMFFDYELEAV